MDVVLWGVHAPGGDINLQFCVNGNNRYVCSRNSSIRGMTGMTAVHACTVAAARNYC